MNLILDRKAVTWDVPSSVWQHPLFCDCAEYASCTEELTIAWCDVGLRRLRHMPSTADQSQVALLDAVQALYMRASKWLESMHDPAVTELRGLLSHLDRLTGTQSKNLSDEMYHRAVTRLAESLPASVRAIIPSTPVSRDDLRATLGLIKILLVDRFFRQNEVWRNRYLKAAYQYADAALQYNSTTDLTRMHPVLAWIRQVLAEQGRTGCSYIDVGCAVAGDSPTVVLASQVLRQDQVVDEVHGTDVVVPSRVLVERMLREHRIKLYSSNPVYRPLPMLYDVILLANVHRHLTHSDQKQMVQHLAMSLKDQGLLFINWRFNDQQSPGICLQRNGHQLQILTEHNCI